ncbi:uncharacterized protein LOC141580522 [Saimiri boliviensis]|uniref:uncharacterized protein LOC141580522 n=1 Tax=Saimiri boliviensis TaxID=27679 RepID=UPI003D77E565
MSPALFASPQGPSRSPAAKDARLQRTQPPQSHCRATRTVITSVHPRNRQRGSPWYPFSRWRIKVPPPAGRAGTGTPTKEPALLATVPDQEPSSPTSRQVRVCFRAGRRGHSVPLNQAPLDRSEASGEEEARARTAGGREKRRRRRGLHLPSSARPGGWGRHSLCSSAAGQCARPGWRGPKALAPSRAQCPEGAVCRAGRAPCKVEPAGGRARTAKFSASGNSPAAAGPSGKTQICQTGRAPSDPKSAGFAVALSDQGRSSGRLRFPAPSVDLDPGLRTNPGTHFPQPKALPSETRIPAGTARVPRGTPRLPRHAYPPRLMRLGPAAASAVDFWPPRRCFAGPPSCAGGRRTLAQL